MLARVYVAFVSDAAFVIRIFEDSLNVLRREKTASFGFDAGFVQRMSDFEVGFSLQKLFKN